MYPFHSLSATGAFFACLVMIFLMVYQVCVKGSARRREWLSSLLFAFGYGLMSIGLYQESWEPFHRETRAGQVFIWAGILIILSGLAYDLTSRKRKMGDKDQQMAP